MTEEVAGMGKGESGRDERTARPFDRLRVRGLGRAIGQSPLRDLFVGGISPPSWPSLVEGEGRRHP